MAYKPNPSADRYYNIPVWAPPGFKVDRPYGEVPTKTSPPQSYLILSAIATIYCPPIGVFALILSLLSIQAHNQGDSDRAKNIGSFALILIISAAVLGTLCIVAIFETCFISDYQRQPKRCVIHIKDYFSWDDANKFS